MRTILAIITMALGAFVSCRQPMTNEEIIAAHKLCESNGMRASHFSSALGFETLKIECAPVRYCEDSK